MEKDLDKKPDFVIRKFANPIILHRAEKDLKYVISNLNHSPAINCRAITGYPYGIKKSCKDGT